MDTLLGYTLPEFIVGLIGLVILSIPSLLIYAASVKFNSMVGLDDDKITSKPIDTEKYTIRFLISEGNMRETETFTSNEYYSSKQMVDFALQRAYRDGYFQDAAGDTYPSQSIKKAYIYKISES